VRRRNATTLGAGLLAALALASPTSAGPVQHPAGPGIDQREVCGACHEREAPVVSHAPVEAGECTACHNPHVARFPALLNDRPGSLCATCHDEVLELLARPTVHSPVAEGRCADCHQPHGGPNPGLLVEQRPQLCARCHEEIAEWKARDVQHAPFAQGKCQTCHDPHSSDQPGLVLRNGSALCSSCHPSDAALRRSHGGQPVETAACQQCHDPHASARAGLFRESVHAPFESGDCTTCHPGPDAAEPFAIVKPIDELCGDCHEDTVRAAREAAFPHVAGGGADCVRCHNPHTGDGTSLLATKPEALCTGCHDPGGALSEGEGRHVTHSGFPCTTCHEPHGGARPVLFTEGPVELCGSCHEHQHGVSHPLGEGTVDPRTGVPLSCRSCHGLHRSEGEKYLFEEDLRMLCVGCHKEMVGR